jgi:hypothetical protein
MFRAEHLIGTHTTHRLVTCDLSWRDSDKMLAVRPEEFAPNFMGRDPGRPRTARTSDKRRTPDDPFVVDRRRELSQSQLRSRSS